MKAALAIAILVTAYAAVTNAQTITMTISSDAAGAPLAGSGTAAAIVSAGSVSRNGVAPAGFSLTTSASSWTLSTPFDVTVTKDLALVSNTYTLQAQLASADSVMSWSIDAVPLNAAALSTITATGAYGSSQPHTFALGIPDSAASGAVNNTINLTAVSN